MPTRFQTGESLRRLAKRDLLWFDWENVKRYLSVAWRRHEHGVNGIKGLSEDWVSSKSPFWGIPFILWQHILGKVRRCRARRADPWDLQPNDDCFVDRCWKAIQPNVGIWTTPYSMGYATGHEPQRMLGELMVSALLKGMKTMSWLMKISSEQAVSATIPSVTWAMLKQHPGLNFNIPDGHHAWRKGWTAVHQHQKALNIHKTKGRGWQSRSIWVSLKNGVYIQCQMAMLIGQSKPSISGGYPQIFRHNLIAASILVAFLVNYHVPFAQCTFEGTRAYHISDKPTYPKSG